MGRWLSRDPVNEKGGLGLYVILNNSQINMTDYLGLSAQTLCGCGDLCIFGETRFNSSISLKSWQSGQTSPESIADVIKSTTAINVMNAIAALPTGNLNAALLGLADTAISQGISPNTTTMIETIIESASAQTQNSGWYIWVKLEWSDCIQESCKIIWKRNNWSPTKSFWYPCSKGEGPEEPEGFNANEVKDQTIITNCINEAYNKFKAENNK